MPIRHHFELHETIATIIADRQDDITAACQGMASARHEVERYILSDPFFKISFDPLPVTTEQDIIIRMAKAAERAGVGPMAAVAGAIALFGVERAYAQGSSFCVIDNGGDIALITDREIRIGLYSGDSPYSGKYAFLIRPQNGIYGVCTSSATVGHSISLGVADSVTVFGKDPILADAIATRVCNILTLHDHSCFEDLPEEIDGIFAIIGDQSIIWGEIPPVVSAQVDERLITSGGIQIA